MTGNDGYPAFVGQANTCEEGLFQCDLNFAIELMDRALKNFLHLFIFKNFAR